MAPLRPLFSRAFTAVGRSSKSAVSVPSTVTFAPTRRTFSTQAQAQPAKRDASEVYHAGLRNTAFTNECELSDKSQVIPIFRVLGYDGKLQGGWQPPFTAEECVERYKFMVRLSVYDMMLYNIQRQGMIYAFVLV